MKNARSNGKLTRDVDRTKTGVRFMDNIVGSSTRSRQNALVLSERQNDDAYLSDFRWLLSQAVLKSKPLVVVSDELINVPPLDVRAAAETVVAPAGYLVVPLSCRGALLENVVNQILARIAVERGEVHETPIARRDAERELKKIARTPDQRIVIIFQSSEQVPTETLRALTRCLYKIKSPDSMPPVILVIGAQYGFFSSNKGLALSRSIERSQIIADDASDFDGFLVESSTDEPNDDTAWQLTRERLGRHRHSRVAAAELSKPAQSLVVYDPINAPRNKIALFDRLLEFGMTRLNLLRYIAARRERKDAELVQQQLAAAGTRKTPTLAAMTSQPPVHNLEPNGHESTASQLPRAPGKSPIQKSGRNPSRTDYSITPPIETAPVSPTPSIASAGRG